MRPFFFFVLILKTRIKNLQLCESHINISVYFPFCNVWFPLWKFNNNYSHLYYILYYIILSIYLSPGRTLEEKRDRKLNPKSFISGIAQEHQMVKRNRFLLRTLLLIVKKQYYSSMAAQVKAKIQLNFILFFYFIVMDINQFKLKKTKLCIFSPGVLGSSSRTFNPLITNIELCEIMWRCKLNVLV